MDGSDAKSHVEPYLVAEPESKMATGDHPSVPHLIGASIIKTEERQGAINCGSHTAGGQPVHDHPTAPAPTEDRATSYPPNPDGSDAFAQQNTPLEHTNEAIEAAATMLAVQNGFLGPGDAARVDDAPVSDASIPVLPNYVRNRDIKKDLPLVCHVEGCGTSLLNQPEY